MDLLFPVRSNHGRICNDQLLLFSGNEIGICKFRVFGHFVRGHADFLERPGFHDHEVMVGRIGIGEDQFDRLARFDGKVGFGEKHLFW